MFPLAAALACTLGAATPAGAVPVRVDTEAGAPATLRYRLSRDALLPRLDRDVASVAHVALLGIAAWEWPVPASYGERTLLSEPDGRAVLLVTVPEAVREDVIVWVGHADRWTPCPLAVEGPRELSPLRPLPQRRWW